MEIHNLDDKKRIRELEAEIRLYKDWLFSYKDDTRLLAFTMKLKFGKIFGTVTGENTNASK